MIEQTLVSLGLSQEEVEIYMSLLEHGTLTPSEISSQTKVKRTYVYKICEDLLIKGLATSTKKGNKKAYAAASPDYLLSIVEKKKQELENSAEQLEKVLGELKIKYSAVETKPVVTFYEGVEGVKKVYRDTLKENKNIDALVQTSKVNPDIYEWVTKEYAAARVEQKIGVKAIVSSGEKTDQYIQLNEKELRETKIVSSDKFPFENELNIYGNKIAIINHRDNTQLFGVIIDSKIVAETFRSWFDLTWGNLR